MRDAASDNQGRYIYSLDDTHWNAEGMEIAARAIARNK
jgi:hypothetical protein